MKVLLLLSSGLCARPSEVLDGRTPLEAAPTPALDRLARTGRLGVAQPAARTGRAATSSDAQVAWLGYDPRRERVGRGGLEALGLDVALEPDDLALRLDLVATWRGRLVEPTAGGLTSAEGRRLVEALADAAGTGPFRFHAGHGHRHLLVVRGGRKLQLETRAPWAGLDREVDAVLPGGPDGPLLADVVERSRELLAGHDVNRVRADLGEPPADLVVPWGPGGPVKLEPFELATGARLAVVPASAQVRGLGRAVGAHVPPAPVEDDVEALGQALARLADHDVVLLHVEGPPPWAEPRQAARRLAELDRRVVTPLAAELAARGEVRLAVVTDRGPQGRQGRSVARPFLLWGPGLAGVREAPFTEAQAAAADLRVEAPHTMLAHLLRPAESLETTG